jgi:hypothetical protein
MILGDAEIRRVKLVDLNPAPYNPRKIDDDAFAGLGSSIDQFGLLSLIIWNESTGNIVGGHQRFRKLVEDGETETDVVVVQLSDDDEVALNILLNNPHARGDFSSDVKVLLEKVEVQIGSVFNDLRLNDLHEQIKKAATPPEPGSREPGKDPPEPPDGEPDDEEPEAVIICPNCKSAWRMKDNEVIRNAATENSEQVDGGDSQAG